MTALAVPHVVEQIGSYAGFVAVVGLAVLSALYISQARDLRRLREWAGRAPERAAEQAARGVAQPVPGRTVTPRPAQPAPAKPAAAPAASGAAPATATAPAGATPAATPAGAAATTPAEGDRKDAEAEEEKAAPDGSPPEVAPVPVATAAAKADEQKQEQGEEEPAASNGAPPEAAPPPPPPQRAPRPATSLPRRPAPPASRPAQTAIPPRPGSKRAGRRGPDPRYIALAVVGVLVIGAGAAIGVPKLLEEDSTPAKREPTQAQSSPRAAVAPDEITVSVLNGTTVPGLAAQVGDQVENEGFVLGNVTNAPDQQRAESIVMYAPGHTRDARLVARRLRLSRDVEAVDPDSQGLAGDATVVVVVGQDQTK